MNFRSISDRDCTGACLKEWNNEKGYLTDTCLTAQDKYKAYLDYFRIAY